MFSIACLLTALAAAPTAPTPTSVTVLKAARLFDGRGDTTLRDAVVIVEAGRIRAVGSALPVPPSARVIELGNATLLPGIVDAHTHLSIEVSDDWNRDTVDSLRRSVPALALWAAAHARSVLQGGVTTAREVGASDGVDAALRDAIAAGDAVGPRLLVALHALGMRGGHCDEQSGFPYLRFGRESQAVDGVAVGADGFRDAVRQQIKYGADVIKVCATGGIMSTTGSVETAQLTLAEIEAVIDEAHRLGKRVAAHGYGGAAVKAAVRAGVDSIEHGAFLDDEALDLMKAHGTTLVPTCLAIEALAERTADLPAAIATKARAARDAQTATLHKAVAKGVAIAFGSDSGVEPHGRNAAEFRLLVQRAGLTPAQALRTVATSARLLGLEAEVGTLEVGKQADIIAVPGDVLADVRATERVFFVMKGGTIHRHDTGAR